MFLVGYWIGTDSGLWAELRRLRWVWLAAALATFTAFVVLMHTTEPVPSFDRAMYDFAQRLNQWTWLLLVLGWGHHLLNRPFRWLPWATSSVYPWYVLHQTITVVAGFWLARLSLGPVVEPVLLVAVTAGGCVLLTDGVIRRSRLLRPMFGMSTDAARHRAKENRTGAEDAGPVETGIAVGRGT